jgi:antitoxin MazE
MKTQIIQIGNSQGIRIPKVLLEECRISGDVELTIQPDGILIRNVQKPRAGWDEAFRSMAEKEEDEPITEAPASAFDRKEWQW